MEANDARQPPIVTTTTTEQGAAEAPPRKPDADPKEAEPRPVVDAAIPTPSPASEAPVDAPIDPTGQRRRAGLVQGRLPDANDRYADIYLNFQDRQEWFAELFAGMTLTEFHDFVDYCFKELDLAAEAKDGAEFGRVKGLIIALARKELEVAHFMDGQTDEQREASRNTATAYYELAKGFYAADKVHAVEAAWSAALDNAAHFGWPSPVFDVLALHQVFKDDPA
jgi:hypothetical protein